MAALEVFFQNGVGASAFVSLGGYEDAKSADAACVQAVAELGTVADAAAWVGDTPPDGYGSGQMVGPATLAGPFEPASDPEPVVVQQDAADTVAETADGSSNDEPDADTDPVEKPAPKRRRSSK